MDDYSFWADVLNKFHTSNDFIKSAWLTIVLTTFLGSMWLIREIFAMFTKAKAKPELQSDERIIYTLTKAEDGAYRIWQHGEPEVELPLRLLIEDKPTTPLLSQLDRR